LPCGTWGDRRARQLNRRTEAGSINVTHVSAGVYEVSLGNLGAIGGLASLASIDRVNSGDRF
jgi:hypothetical protein